MDVLAVPIENGMKMSCQKGHGLAKYILGSHWQMSVHTTPIYTRWTQFIAFIRPGVAFLDFVPLAVL